MAGKATLKTLGNWRKEIGVPMRQVLAIHMDVTGKTGEQACRQSIVGMATSAGSTRGPTKMARKNRKVQRDSTGNFVQNYRPRRRGVFQKLYKWMFDADNPQEKIPGSWDNARRIGNRGLARRSWLWGLGKLGARRPGAAIRGTSRVYTISGETVNGYVKENRLHFIRAALAPGWEQIIALAAGNKIMARARSKLERQLASRARSRQLARQRSIQTFFKRLA